MKKTMLTIVAIMVAFFTMTAYAGETAAPQELSKKELKELEKKKKMMEDSSFWTYLDQVSRKSFSRNTKIYTKMCKTFENYTHK